MSGIRSLSRRPHITEFFATASSAPVYVNDTDSSVRVVPAGTGASECVIPFGVGGVTGAFRYAQGSGTLVTGAATIATGLSTVTSFQAMIYGATGFSTGATEVSDLIVSSITTGAVLVKGVYNSFSTGAATISVSGTATFYWLAFGT